MDPDNVIAFIKNQFIVDNITRDDIYTDSKVVTNVYEETEVMFDVPEEFNEYIHYMCQSASDVFYEFCREQENFDPNEEMEKIEEFKGDIDALYGEDYDPEDMDYIYGCFFNEVVAGFYRYNNFDVFLDIITEIENEKEEEKKRLQEKFELCLLYKNKPILNLDVVLCISEFL